jgi:peptide deformylase
LTGVITPRPRIRTRTHRSPDASVTQNGDSTVPERPIRLFGDPVLKTVSDPIVTIDDRVRGLVKDLVDSVLLPGRAGVAAAQIGVNLRAFSYNVDGQVGYILNPVIAELVGEPELVDEGCLSVPGLWYPTSRYPFARVTGIDLDGNAIELSGTGVMAQALQHETDHLNGLLYLDRLDTENRRAAMKEVRESDWF